MSKFMGAQRAFLIGLLILMGTLGGCIIVPIPTGEYGEGFNDSQVQERLSKMPFTRIDALLTFGEPTWRKEEDRLFIYRWERSHLSFLVASIGPWTVHTVYRLRYLAMEFNPAGELQRHKYFGRWFEPSHDEFLNELFSAWVNEQSGDPH